MPLADIVYETSSKVLEGEIFLSQLELLNKPICYENNNLLEGFSVLNTLRFTKLTAASLIFLKISAVSMINPREI